MLMSRTIRLRAPHILVARDRNTGLKISGACNNKGGGLMVE